MRREDPVVAVVTGLLADRLRAERNRYQEAAEALREAYAAAQVRAEERLQVDRFVTIGRLASGVADQVRNPLAALAGCLEILEAGLPRGHPKAEFVEVAKKEIARLDGLIRDFLEFARPTRPAPRLVDLQQVLRATARLAQSVLTAQEVALEFAPRDRALVVEADDEQLKRALLSLVLEMAALSRGDRVTLMVRAEDGAALVRVGAEVDVIRTPELFEPFSSAATERGLALAIARRLIENQRGSVQVEQRERMLYCVVCLPLAPPEPETRPQVPLRGTDTHRSRG